MTSTKLLIYNCFIILLCSPDNNGVAGVFLIIWHFFCSLSRTSGNCGENNDCLPACLPLSLMDCTSQTVSVQPRALSRRLLGCLLKLTPFTLQVISGPVAQASLMSNLYSSVSLKVYDRLQLASIFVVLEITDFLTNSHFLFVLFACFANTSLKT